MRRAHQVRYQRGQAVIIAESDLFVSDGVVFIHDRHDVQLRQRFEGPSSVQVLPTMRKVQRREQHLAHLGSELTKSIAPGVHQQRLSHGRDRLERNGVTRTRTRLSNLCPTGSNRARRHDDDRPPFVAQCHDVGGDTHQDVVGDVAVGVSD